MGSPGAAGWSVELPGGYSLDESETPFVHVLEPSGRRIPGLHFHGPSVWPEEIQEAVFLWEKQKNQNRHRENGEDFRPLARKKSAVRPSVHELLCEVLDATDWTGVEKNAWLESFRSAAMRDVKEVVDGR